MMIFIYAFSCHKSQWPSRNGWLQWTSFLLVFGMYCIYLNNGDSITYALTLSLTSHNKSYLGYLFQTKHITIIHNIVQCNLFINVENKRLCLQHQSRMSFINKVLAHTNIYFWFAFFSHKVQNVMLFKINTFQSHDVLDLCNRQVH